MLNPSLSYLGLWQGMDAFLNNVTKLGANVQSNEPAKVAKNEKAWETAKEFEASFIAQMLTYSGLAEALTSSGGEDVASFSQFYIESIAKDLTDNGGFGLAEKIYEHIEKKMEGSNGDLGRL